MVRVTWKSIGSISPEAKRGNRRNRRNVKSAILVPTRVTTRLTSRLAVSLPTVGPPSPRHQTGALSLKTVAGSRAYPSGPSACGFTDFGHVALAASQDFPVDELPEGRVDPRLHLGFFPVLSEPPGPEGVLRPLQPARPIVVAQDAALSHVVAVGTKEHHVEGEGHFGAPAGSGGHVIEDSDELGLFHEDLADPMELLIEVVHHARLEIVLEGLDLAAREVHGDDDGRNDRHRLDEREQLRETDVDHWGPDGRRASSTLRRAGTGTTVDIAEGLLHRSGLRRGIMWRGSALCRP